MTSNRPVEAIYGNIPDNWNMISIGHLEDEGKADLQTGPFGTMLHASSYVPSGIPVIAVKNIGENRILDNDFVFVDAIDAERLKKYRLQSGDIIFGRKGAVDRRALITKSEDGWLQGSDCIRLRLDSSNIDCNFISYVLGSPQYKEWILRNAQGATMPSLNQRIIRRIPIPFPQIEEQKAIAAVLGAFDDKIELNRQMNATLEEMARAIFKSWFVDFDPVRAKARGEQPYGMDAETAALFPDRFEVVNGREVPAGWRTVKIKEISNLLRNNIRPQDSPNELFEYYSIPAFDQGQMPILELGNEIRSNKYIVPEGSILLSKLNPRTPRVWYPNPNDYIESICSTEFLVLVPKELISREYLFGALTSRRFQQRFSTLVTGTSSSHQRVKPNYLKEMEIILPSQNTLTLFTNFTSCFYDKVIHNRLESESLTKIRDALLPHLMSGKIRI